MFGMPREGILQGTPGATGHGASARSSPDPAARPAFCVLTFCFCLPRPPKRRMAVGASAGWRRSAIPSVFTGTRRLPNFVSQVASLPSVSRLVLAQMRQTLHHWYTSLLSRTFLSDLSHLTTKVVYLPRPLAHKKTFILCRPLLLLPSDRKSVV